MKKKTKKIKQKKENIKLLKLLKYFIKFFILSLPILWIKHQEFYFIQKIITIIISFLLNSININNIVFNTLGANLTISPALSITNHNLIVVIDFACTGVRSLYLLFCLLFALPKKFNLKSKINYLFFGGIILFLVNIFRIFIVTLLFLKFNLTKIFENMIWSLLLNITIFIIFYYYLKRNDFKK